MKLLLDTHVFCGSSICFDLLSFRHMLFPAV